MADDMTTAQAQATAQGPSGDALIRVSHLSKSFVAATNFFGRPTSFVRAVDDVSFTIGRGEAFGLVGESGCGKTTIGKMLVGLLKPTSGRIYFEGEDVTDASPRRRRELCRDIQLIFQDPYASLNPRMTVEQIVAEPITTNHILPADQVGGRVDELLERVGIRPDLKRRYPHEFSGGQRQRVGIARALAVSPKLIVCDEPVSALDVSIQAQVLNLLDDLKDELGLTYLFIAHGLNVVKHVSDRVGVMYLGRLMEVAQKNDLYHEPLCPYTQALLSAIPSPDPRLSRKRIILSGDVPSPIDPPEGCRFASRCFAKVGACDVAAPELREVAPGHLCACHRHENMAADDVRAVARRIQYEAARPTYGMGGSDANADPVSSDPDTPDEAAEKGEELPV